MSHSAKQQIDLKSDVLINTAMTAILLGIPAATLSKWRSTGEVDLPFVKIGRGVKYNTADLRQWIEANTHNKMGVKVS